MNRFKQFLRLYEGGFASVDGKAASKLPLSFDRDELIQLFDDCFKDMNNQYEKKIGEKIWTNYDKIFKSGELFSGSARMLFDKKIDYDELIKVKGKLGDIDLKVPQSVTKNLQEFLNNSKGKLFGKLKFVGIYSTFGTLCVFEMPKKYHKEIQYVEIDFNPAQWTKGGTPEPFSVFSFYASWKDMTQGIKGLMKSAYLKAYTERKSLGDIIIQTKTGKESKSKRDIIPYPYFFDIQRGVKLKYIPVIDEDGTHLKKGGKEVWKEGEEYVTDMNKIFTIFYGQEPESKRDIESMYSVTGLLELSAKYHDKKTIEEHFEMFVEFLIGTGEKTHRTGKLVENDDAEKDLKWKMAVINLWFKQFPELKRFDKYIEMQAPKYYKFKGEKIKQFASR